VRLRQLYIVQFLTLPDSAFGPSCDFHMNSYACPESQQQVALIVRFLAWFLKQAFSAMKNNHCEKHLKLST